MNMRWKGDRIKMSDIFEQLPSVNDVMQDDGIKSLIEQEGRETVKACIRLELEEKRNELSSNSKEKIDFDSVVSEITLLVKRESLPSLRPVINCTGVILHTNLGRSVLSNSIKDYVNDIAFGYSNLEFSLAARKRGDRYSHVSKLLEKLTGAEDSLVVNNNAAAVLLILDTIAKNKRILVSRGELVEIGGSFRIPEIITSVGGHLKEVGTTNKTHPLDYEEAFDEETAAILKVHTSNYKIIGFTESVPEERLQKIAHKNGVPLITDLGSGLLYDLTKFGISGEPTVQQVLKYSDLVAFSGDKLLGGPQAGIIVGKKQYIKQLKKNQLLRALRVDKLTLSALGATLALYQQGDKVLDNVPTLKMLTIPYKQLKERASELMGLLRAIPSLMVSVSNDFSEVGGGTFPALKLKTFVIEVSSDVISTPDLEKKLREAKIPIIVRVQNDRVQFDVRTILDGQIKIIVETMERAILIHGN